jgi:putative lipoic acid-binding regulatory protein
VIESRKLEKIRQLLTEQYTWPTGYCFKFVVPKESVGEVRALFPEHEISTRQSKNGKYVSLTIDLEMESADHVVAVYEKASCIKGIFSL